MGFENQFIPQPTPDQKRTNYEHNVADRAKEGNTILQNILKNGETVESQVHMDAITEEKYRKLKSQGVISEQEFEILTKTDLQKEEDGADIIIKGTINGSAVNVREKGFRGRHIPRRPVGGYDGIVNGSQIVEEDAKALFDELQKKYEQAKSIRNTIAVVEAKNIIEN
jgi:hypothetical protein